MPGDYASLNESSVAGTVAAEYVGSERMKFSTRLEARRATSLDSYLHTAAVAYSCRRTGPCCCATACSWTSATQRRRRDPAAPANRRGLPPGGQRPLQFPDALRASRRAPVGAATSYLAGSAGGLDSGFLASGLRQDTHILSAHANWQPVSKLTLSGRTPSSGPPTSPTACPRRTGPTWSTAAPCGIWPGAGTPACRPSP